MRHGARGAGHGAQGTGHRAQSTVIGLAGCAGRAGLASRADCTKPARQ
jgi:hypothetical protein